MPNRLFPFATLIATLLTTATLASAGSIPNLPPPPSAALTFSYTITPGQYGPTSYGYDFVLTDTGLPAGTELGWLIFGAVEIPSGWDGTGTPPMGYGVGAFGTAPAADWWTEDFYMTSAVPAPWTYLTGSEGGFNGPTFGYVLDSWVPQVGDSISWSGWSHHNVGGSLELAFLNVNGGSSPYLVVQGNGTQTPEPATTALIGGGLLGLWLLLRRRTRYALAHGTLPR